MATDKEKTSLMIALRGWKMPTRAARSYAVWTTSEYNFLISEVERNIPIDEIAKTHQRSVSGIKKQLWWMCDINEYFNKRYKTHANKRIIKNYLKSCRFLDKKAVHKNAGERWTTDDYEKLDTLLKKAASFDVMVKKLGRSPSAILHIIEHRQGAYMRDCKKRLRKYIKETKNV
jgi:hypothetical protein